MTWHVPHATLRGYVDGLVSDSVGWSIEAHLVDCETCRRALASAAEGSAVEPLLVRVWAAMPPDLPRQGTVRRSSRTRVAFGLAVSASASRGAWLLVTTAMLAVSFWFDSAGLTQGVAGDGVSWLALLAPLIPVAGVALSYGSGLDDSSEIIASTPAGGLRLLLWRTVAVLVVVLPATLLVNVVADSAPATGWLVAALALTSLTLAVGSFVGVETAAVVVGALWAVGVLGPTLFANDISIQPDSVRVWLPTLVFSSFAMALRAGSFARLPLTIRHRIGVSS